MTLLNGYISDLEIGDKKVTLNHLVVFRFKPCSKFQCSRPEHFEVPAVVLHELSVTAPRDGLFLTKDLRQVPTK